MRCPTLEQLPPPPPGKTGWPWTEESPQLPDAMPDGRPWPRVSIITPSYQQGQFIEETIRSVLLQGYPDLEYIVIDGGSTDDSPEIIRKYSTRLTYWVSEPDRGQAHAINKGFVRSTGDLIAWINSDDLFLPSALTHAAKAHHAHPDRVLLGSVEHCHDNGMRFLVEPRNVTFVDVVGSWCRGCVWSQQGMFVPRTVFEAAGELDENLHYAFDRDWLCRLTRQAEVAYLRTPVAQFRQHANQKTAVGKVMMLAEDGLITRRYWDGLPDSQRRELAGLQCLAEAKTLLGYHPEFAAHWNRPRGARLLLSAFFLHPMIVSRADFRQLSRRLFLPKRLLRSGPWSA